VKAQFSRFVSTFLVPSILVQPTNTSAIPMQASPVHGAGLPIYMQCFSIIRRPSSTSFIYPRNATHKVQIPGLLTHLRIGASSHRPYVPEGYRLPPQSVGIVSSSPAPVQGRSRHPYHIHCPALPLSVPHHSCSTLLPF